MAQSLGTSLSEPRSKPNSLGLTAVSPRRTALPPPNKHMLFRPTLGQLLIYIANAYKVPPPFTLTLRKSPKTPCCSSTSLPKASRPLRPKVALR